MKNAAALILIAISLGGCFVTTRAKFTPAQYRFYQDECAGKFDVTCERFKYTDPRYNEAMRNAGGG
jgi:hypothetical protein